MKVLMRADTHFDIEVPRSLVSDVHYTWSQVRKKKHKTLISFKNSEINVRSFDFKCISTGFLFRVAIFTIFELGILFILFVCF